MKAAGLEPGKDPAVLSAWACGTLAPASVGRLTSKDATDDFLNGNLLNIEIADGHLIESGFAGGDDLAALDAQGNTGGIVFDHLAIFGH